MVTKSSREMQKDREKIRPPFGGLKFCQGTHYLPLTPLARHSLMIAVHCSQRTLYVILSIT